MPAVATTENTPRPGAVLLPARLIPGVPLGVPGARRDKLASAEMPCFTSGWGAMHKSHTPESTELWHAIADVFLPRPARTSQRLALVEQVVADFFVLAVGFVCIGLLQTFLNTATRRASGAPVSVTGAEIGLLLLYGTVFTLFGYSERLYHPETLRAPQQQAKLLAKVFVWSTVLVSIGFAPWAAARGAVMRAAPATPISFLVMLAYRQLRRRRCGQQRPNARGVRNVLIVGSGPLARKLARVLKEDQGGGRAVTGFLDENQPVHGDVLGRVKELASIARKEFVDEIIIAVPSESAIARKAIWHARRNHIDVKLVPDLFGADLSQVTVETFDDVPVMTLWEEPVPVFRLLLKRVADLLLSATALLAASPLLCAITIAIKLDSRGSVLYCAPRVGLNGRRFLCYKFRTMVSDAEQLKENLRGCNERQGPFFKMTSDPRITRVGRILRRYSLDELPQLWNVLKGEMSLVGPRPHPVDDVERYRLEDFQRLEVMPGLTGLWQVTARQDPSFAKSMALDREYIGRWSLAMDFRILCRTVSAILRGQGT